VRAWLADVVGLVAFCALAVGVWGLWGAYVALVVGGGLVFSLYLVGGVLARFGGGPRRRQKC
jgi:hypothetical protein